MSTVTNLGFNLTAGTRDLEKGLDESSGKIKEFAKGAAVAMVAAGVGMAFTGSVTAAIEQMDASSKLQAQLGTTSNVAAKHGKLAGKLFTNGISDTFTEGTDAIKQIMQQGLAPPDATNKQLKSIATNALDIAHVFDQDLPTTINAVSQMVKTGLAKNSKQAFDILTRGFQVGNNKADDLLETMGEYGTQFRKLGIEGPQAMGIIRQLLQGGARDTDLAADAIKEFSIRAMDGSESSAAGFKAVGLSASKMTAEFNKGGTTAQKSFDLVVDRLNKMKDPVERNTAGVALFGTQWEDLGDATRSLDPSKATAALGKIDGAAKTAGETIRSGATHEFKVLGRTVQQFFIDILAGPVASATNDFIAFSKTTLIPGIKSIGSAFTGMIPIDSIQDKISKAKGWLADFFKGARGKVAKPSAADTFGINPKAMTGKAVPMAAPPIKMSSGAEMGASITSALKSMDAKEIGGILGKILGKAIGVALDTMEDIGSKIIGVFKSVDWVDVGKEIGGNAIGFAIGFISKLGADLFTFKFWKEHFFDVLLAVLIVFPLAGKILGAIGKMLSKIPGAKIFAPLFEKMSAALGPFSRLFDKIWIPLKEGFLAGFTKIFPAASGAIGRFFSSIGGKIAGTATHLKDKAIVALRGLGEGLGAGVAHALVFLKDIGVKIVKPFAQAATWLIGRGKSVLSGLKNGAVSAAKGIGGWIKSIAITPIVNMFKSAGSLLLSKGRSFVSGLKSGIKSAAGGIGSWMTRTVVTPVISAFNVLKSGVNKVKDAFGTAQRGIKSVWEKLKSATKGPVKFFVETVYNNGLRAAWNNTAGKIPGVPDMAKANLPRGFAKGGPVGNGKRGYIGRGPKGPVDKVPIMAQAGEYVIRAKRVREIGKPALDWLNGGSGDQARNRTGGMPGYSLGGWVGDTVGSLTDKAKGGFDWAAGILKSGAAKALTALFKPVRGLVNGIADSVPGGGIVSTFIKEYANSGFDKMIEFVKGKATDDDGGNGKGGVTAAKALAWARTQHGKRYQWGGNGNPSWDCSGFVSAIESKLRGQSAHRRWSTHAFSGNTAPNGWERNRRSAYTIGVTNAGVGHTAGTLSGVNVESRGGDGVIVGKKARGANSMYFRDVYGYKPLAYSSGGMIPTQRMDSGGTLPRGLSMVNNTTGAPETLSRERNGGGACVHNYDLRGAIISSKKDFEDLVVEANRNIKRKGRHL